MCVCVCVCERSCYFSQSARNNLVAKLTGDGVSGTGVCQ